MVKVLCAMLRFTKLVSSQARLFNPSSNNILKFCSTVPEKDFDIDKIVRKKNSTAQIFSPLQTTPSLENAIKILSSLVRKSYKYTDIESEPGFQTLVNVLNKSVEKNLGSPQAFQIIHCLNRLKVSEDNALLQSLHQSLEAQRETSTISGLLEIVSFNTMPALDLDRLQYFQKTVQLIEMRFEEISAEEIEKCYEYREMFSKNFLFNLDEHTMFLSRTMPVEQMCTVVRSLVKAERSRLVLHTFLRRISRSKEEVPQKLACQTLGLLLEAKVLDLEVLAKLSKDFVSPNNSIPSGSTLADFLYIIGRTRWKDPQTLNRICQGTDLKQQRPKELKTLLQTLAIINYIPDNVEKLATIVWDFHETFVRNQDSLIDMIWSLAVLGLAKKEHLESALVSVKIEEFQYSDSRFDKLSKLMQINAVARESSSYNGPLLSIPSNLWKRAGIKRGLKAVLFPILSSMNLQMDDASFDVRTPYGFVIDAEFFIDPLGKFLNIKEYRNDNFEMEKQLPDGSRKVAVFQWTSNDLTTGTSDVIGFHNLSMDILRQKGYQVLELPHSTRYDKKLNVQNFIEEFKTVIPET